MTTKPEKINHPAHYGGENTLSSRPMLTLLFREELQVYVYIYEDAFKL